MAASILAPITNASKLQKLVIGLFVLVVLVGAGYFLLVVPLDARVSELKTKNDALQAEVTQHRAVAANYARFKQEATALKARLEAVRERLPKEKEVPPLYRSVSDLAFRSGLAVSLFQPKEPQPKDYYMEIPITLTAEASYHQLGTFLDRLARLSRIVNVEDVRLTSVNKPGTSLRADLTLMTYTYRTEDSPPPKPAVKP